MWNLFGLASSQSVHRNREIDQCCLTPSQPRRSYQGDTKIGDVNCFVDLMKKIVKHSQTVRCCCCWWWWCCCCCCCYVVFFFFFISFFLSSRWGTADAELEIKDPPLPPPLVGAQGYQRFPQSKPVVGQNIALHAAPADTHTHTGHHSRTKSIDL